MLQIGLNGRKIEGDLIIGGFYHFKWVPAIDRLVLHIRVWSGAEFGGGTNAGIQTERRAKRVGPKLKTDH